MVSASRSRAARSHTCGAHVRGLGGAVPRCRSRCSRWHARRERSSGHATRTIGSVPGTCPGRATAGLAARLASRDPSCLGSWLRSCAGGRALHCSARRQRGSDQSDGNLVPKRCGNSCNGHARRRDVVFAGHGVVCLCFHVITWWSRCGAGASRTRIRGPGSLVAPQALPGQRGSANLRVITQRQARRTGYCLPDSSVHWDLCRQAKVAGLGINHGR